MVPQGASHVVQVATAQQRHTGAGVTLWPVVSMLISLFLLLLMLLDSLSRAQSVTSAAALGLEKAHLLHAAGLANATRQIAV